MHDALGDERLVRATLRFHLNLVFALLSSNALEASLPIGGCTVPFNTVDQLVQRQARVAKKGDPRNQVAT